MKSTLLSLYQRWAARRMFARWSPSYEDDVAENFYSAAHAVARETIARLPRQPAPHIADIGIGTGLLSARIKETLPCHITGLDFTDDMLAVAAMRGVASTLVKCDVGKDIWPLKDHSFEAAISAGLLEYLTPVMLQHYLTQCSRILKDDGIIVLTYIPDAKTQQIYWNGKTGGYLCCTYNPTFLENALEKDFSVLVHKEPFPGCVFQDGSQYDYRLIVARKKPNARSMSFPKF